MNKLVEYSEVLDENKLIEMYVQFLIRKKDNKVIDFVLILFLIRDEKTKIQIIKYDYSLKEDFNVHKYYLKSERKEYIDEIINPEKINELIREIKRNYKKYLLLYYQKEYI